MRALLLRLLSCVPALAVVVALPPSTNVRDTGTVLAQDAGAPSVMASSVTDSAMRKTSTISSRLDKLYRIDILARSAGAPITTASAAALPRDLQGAVQSGELRLDAAGSVQVFVILDDATDATAAAAELGALGMTLEHVSDEYGIVQGMLPIAALEAAAAVPGVVQVRPPDRPVLETGSVNSQGDAILDANDLRSTFDSDGTGVKVGVISDGLDNANLSQASGDLPPSIDMSCDVGPGAPTASGAGDEGTAMLEIVHDLAPGAELWFGHFGFAFGGTSLDFMAAVDCLAASTDVVIDDIGFFNAGLYDGTSDLSVNASTELNLATNRIRGYYNAVANHAQRHYEEPYLDSGVNIALSPPSTDFWSVHRYTGTANTTDAGFGLFCSVTGNHRCGDELTLAPGASVFILLQWNDPWGNSTNDYDLLVQDEGDGFVYVVSDDRQTGAGSFPIESFGYNNPTGANLSIDIIIGNYRDTAANRTFDSFISSCSACFTYGNGAIHNYNTTRGSVPNNSDAGGGVMSLGAINQADPGNNDIETFSSRGPTNDLRTKPDAAAIDGVNITGAGGFSNPFFGSSAAAPHAGAVAALVLSCRQRLLHGEVGDTPAADRTALRAALTGSAVDLGTAGIDNTFGAGRLDADAAATAAGCSPDTDGDGCSNAEELGPEWSLGGDRNPNDIWDYYDVTGDKLIDFTDTIAILDLFGTGVGGPGYLASYDRYAPNPLKLWQTALAIDGTGIDLTDALFNLDSFGADCTAAF